MSELNTINNDTTAEKRKQFNVRFTVDQDGSTTTETYQTYYGETLTLTDSYRRTGQGVQVDRV